MQVVQELQSAVSQLSADELACFREWFDEFDAEVWDQQFKKDVKLGRLDQLAEQVIIDLGRKVLVCKSRDQIPDCRRGS